ncbi:hypothetical protein HY382_01075 [Candidatus Curtissbacteria bacterium]|nr:hypothetical protein [Candidatus Curtissbacteria bacterium]
MLANDYKNTKVKNNSSNLVGQVRLKIVVIFGSIIMVLFASQLVFANNLAAEGERLSQIESEIQLLEAQNTTLKAEIAQNSSLVTLSAKAQAYGFVKPKIITP